MIIPVISRQSGYVIPTWLCVLTSYGTCCHQFCTRFCYARTLCICKKLAINLSNGTTT